MLWPSNLKCQLSKSGTICKDWWRKLRTLSKKWGWIKNRHSFTKKIMKLESDSRAPRRPLKGSCYPSSWSRIWWTTSLIWQRLRAILSSSFTNISIWQWLLKKLSIFSLTQRASEKSSSKELLIRSKTSTISDRSSGTSGALYRSYLISCQTHWSSPNRMGLWK